jgi:hypothetical protein
MTTLYVAARGYTGEDLVDPEQPVFVLATHAIDEPACAALLQRYPTKKQAPDALRELAAAHRPQILVGVVDKRYALLGKIVDLVVETSMREAGFDLYKNGGNVAMANVMYATLDADAKYFDRVLRAFQKWMRERSSQRQQDLDKLLERAHPDEPIDHVRKMIYGGLLHLKYAGVFEGVARGALDVAPSTLESVLAMWPTPPLALVCDRATKLPGLEGATRVDGKTSPGVQVAQLIAGAATNDEFAGNRDVPSGDHTPEGMDPLEYIGKLVEAAQLATGEPQP